MSAPAFTSLQLAEILATAARESSEQGAPEAILLTLHACGCCFRRVSEDEDGTTVEEPMLEQQELFS